MEDVCTDWFWWGNIKELSNIGWSKALLIAKKYYILEGFLRVGAEWRVEFWHLTREGASRGLHNCPDGAVALVIAAAAGTKIMTILAQLLNPYA